MVSYLEEHDGREIHISAVVPGPLSPEAEVRVREACMNGLDDWTAVGESPFDRGLG